MPLSSPTQCSNSIEVICCEIAADIAINVSSARRESGYADNGVSPKDVVDIARDILDVVDNDHNIAAAVVLGLSLADISHVDLKSDDAAKSIAHAAIGAARDFRPVLFPPGRLARVAPADSSMLASNHDSN